MGFNTCESEGKLITFRMSPSLTDVPSIYTQQTDVDVGIKGRDSYKLQAALQLN